jgi:hypothetical protein
LYDVSIAYRIYPGVSKQPLVFADDKYKLSELCIHSLQKSLIGVKARIYVLLDGCPPQYEELFRRYFTDEDLRFLYLDKIGNTGTFSKQIEILLNQDDSDYIYFAEDDYLYKPQCFGAMLDFLKENLHNNFVTPFDHLDYYQHPLHDEKYRLLYTQSHHWRSAFSTCLTFLTTKETLNKTKDTFLSYMNGNWDASIFFALTKAHVYSPTSLLRFLIDALRGNTESLKIVASAWLHSTPQILFGERYTVWAPLPSIATHLQYDTIAPCINWQQEIGKLL